MYDLKICLMFFATSVLKKNFTCKKNQKSEANMSKSIYSLLLSDDVVQQLDEVAASRGLSRSAVIDAILAEYTGVSNGDEKMRNVWQEMEKLLARTHTMHFVNNAQTNLAQIVTTLPFKYSPKIRYQLELSNKDDRICAITLNTRTQNPLLTTAFDNFYQRLAVLERQYLNNVSARYGNGKYVSVLFGSRNEPTDIACDVLEYVVTLDGMLRSWLNGDEQTVVNLFADYVAKHHGNRLSDDDSYLLR